MMRRRTSLFSLLFSLLFLGGFALFCYDTRHQSPPQQIMPDIEAIVVLTGGSERIHISLELLKTHPNLTLLISGVPPYVSLKNILQYNDPSFPPTLYHQITLDTHALTTIGNALETTKWARRNHFHHILLVTSNYHMRRALLEFQQYAPEISFTAYPVFPNNFETNFQYNFTYNQLGLFFLEYSKFLISMIKNIIFTYPLASVPHSESFTII